MSAAEQNPDHAGEQ